MLLTTVEAVIDGVGGEAEAAKLAGVGTPAVSNWKARGRIAADKAMIFGDALARRGLRADPSVFGMVSAPTQEARA